MVTAFELRTYLEDTFGDDIQYVYRHFPLSFHTLAPITAEATEAAAAQGKFWEMHDLLYERQQDWGGLGSEEAVIDRVTEYADEMGLDTDRFRDELENHVHRAKVDEDLQGAVALGLPGTPSYIINGIVDPMSELGLDPAPITAFINLWFLDQYAEPPPEVIDTANDYIATIRTNRGDIVVELFDDQAPANVNSFVFLSREGWYDDHDFFFVQPGGAAYSGDPTGMGWVFSFPGYRCGDEKDPGLTFDDAGVLALYSNTPDSNSSMFFITSAPLPQNNGQYTVIGQVVEGMDVVTSLTPVQPNQEGVTPDVIGTIEIEER